MKMDSFLGRPLLHPELPRVWRDAETLQLGVTPERGVILTHLSTTLYAALKRMDGKHSMREILHFIEKNREDTEAFAEIFSDLAQFGALEFLPERQSTDMGVLLECAGAVGPALGAVLAEAGVRKIHAVTSPHRSHGRVTNTDITSAGLSTHDLHTPYLTAARAHIRGTGTHIDTSAFSLQETQCAVVTDLTPGNIAHTRKYVAAGVPHLAVSLLDGFAVVGPLVLPGYTACLNCLEEYRYDTDTLWPILTAQLGTQRALPCAQRPLTVSAAMATYAASLAATQLLAWMRGREPEALGAVLECGGEGGALTHTPVEKHPACTWH